MNPAALLKLLRPHQWVKNLMVYFPLFLSGSLLHIKFSPHVLLPFAAFCCASSAGYIFNDLVDRPRDAVHPLKQSRPLPAGQVTVCAAVTLCTALTVLTCLVGLAVSREFALYVGAYLLTAVCYSLLLKEIAVLDIYGISLGFVIRLYGGGVAFNVEITDWLFLTVFLLSVFLSFGKRYSEIRLLGDDAGLHRRILKGYPPEFLEGGMYLSGATVLVTYAMYAMEHPPMVYSVPLCMYGLLRYQMRIKGGASGDPTESLLKDPPLFVTGFIWVVFSAWSIYR